MTYDPKSPKAQLSPSISPSQIKTNFIVFSNAISANHVAMNSLGQGKHTKVVFKKQSSDPNVTSTFGVLYAKTANQTSGDAINIFYKTIKIQGGIDNTPQQMTFNIVSLTGYTTGVFFNQQQSFLWGGFIVYTGSLHHATSLSVNIDVAPMGSGIPKPLRLVYAKVNGTTVNNGFGYSVFLNNSGSIFNLPSATAGDLNYFAIGLV